MSGLPDDDLTPVAEANRQQILASDPQVSVFVSASAGSGKTKLLIDRLLRLMLPRPARPERLQRDAEPGAAVVPDPVLVVGTNPARIQCLTFTKAAAAEMSIRLQRRLGRWVTLDDAALDRELAALDVPPEAATRAAARALFARVLDLPGGMRIGTIHAFCQSLLRRFPLEAAISPHFRLAEDTDARVALNEAVEMVLAARAGPDPSLGLLAGQIGAGDFASLVGKLQAASRAPGDGSLSDLAALSAEALGDALWRATGVAQRDESEVLAQAVAWPGEAHLRAMLELVQQHGASGARGKVPAWLDWLAQDAPGRAAAWGQWRGLLLTQAGEARKPGGIFAGNFMKQHPQIADALAAEAERVLAVEDAVRALRMAELSAALLAVALPILGRHAAGKAESGMLDYDDLIARTLALLDDPGVAWVLYKLDGGIDHLLLDEVQDTSPLQWQIAWALTVEFFAGSGATPSVGPGGGDERPLPRTIFAVGDFKQSIYSFQGADPGQFHGWRERFRARVTDGGETWREPSLTVSFRSVEPVLRLVDAVFADPAAARGVAEPGQGPQGGGPLLRHRASRAHEPGRVELWPLAPREAADPGPGPWEAPARNAGQRSAPQRLAESLARWIAGEIGRPAMPGAAPLKAADVLVLVPRRSAFVRSLIRALKTQDVPVATLVRTGLVDQVAVQDLLALCDALLLPQDDLTVAAVLTGPLGGLTDDAMMQLATTRAGLSLWDSLRDRHATRPDWSQAWTMLAGLFGRVDYASPYALLGEALGPGGGRARLLARLGPEAAEPVDELLAAALRYEAAHAASLQGFLHWIRTSEATIKREPDSAGDAVRVMTVHGAKGLQARLVVLPDTLSRPPSDETLLWTRDPLTGTELPFWVPRAELACLPTRALSEVLRAATVEEQNRLLYVALTRASDRLVVCGWAGKAPPPEDCWYEQCRRGFERAGAVPAPFEAGWPGERLLLESLAPASLAPPAAPAPPPPSLPDWLGRAPDWRPTPPPAEPPVPNPLAPSRPDDVGFGPRPALRSPLAREGSGVAPGASARDSALRRGRLMHVLLQHLPGLPQADRAAAAAAYAAHRSHGLDALQARTLVRQALEVIAEPRLATLFGPAGRAEQPLVGLAEGVVVAGQVDRLCVEPDRVTVCDFKTGQAPPAAPEQVPLLYLRQMAAYRALLRALYPGRTIYCLLVWTEGPAVMQLPDTALDRYGPGVRRGAGAAA
ncbi:double-strand break repair helicase AddA [Lichenicoccus sp.]|uniref:double-strand break repair helicase AddA n=1 Tax=Lichenicoccus sp. TaxID=2781899 RepID=UPI003D145815